MITINVPDERHIMRLLSICVFSLLMVSNKGYAIELGDGLPEDSRPTGEKLMINSAQLSNTYEVEETGVKYLVTLDQGKIIDYVSPLSKTFVTPEGIHVGSTYDEVRAVTVTKESMQSELGWGHFIRLPSGWMAGFCIGDACDDYPNLQDKVDWLFKR